MTDPTKTQPIKTPLSLTAFTKLSADLEAKLAPHRDRKEKKVKKSVLGLFVMLIGVGVLAFTGFLATYPTPNIWVLGGGAGLACGIMAWGGLVADPETFGPALRGMVKYGIAFMKARKG